MVSFGLCQPLGGFSYFSAQQNNWINLNQPETMEQHALAVAIIW